MSDRARSDNTIFTRKQRQLTLLPKPGPSASTSVSADPRLRGGLLMPVCALAVHQTRYYLAFGGHARYRLAHDGHAYLSWLEPCALLAVALALGLLIGALARVWQRRGSAPSQGPSASPTIWSTRARVWAACALALLALYGGQELCEGMLS